MDNGWGFVHTEGKYLVDSQGDTLLLRGLGLGGWLIPEGYMLHIPGFGSPTSIRNMIEELIGPQDTDQFFQIYRENYVNEIDIKKIAEWGFNSIRLPFHYAILYDKTTDQFREEGFQLLDRFLSWCKKYQLYVILDMHAAPGGQNADNISDSDGIEARLWTEPQNQDLTIKIWKEIARRYANEEWIIGYDILNEPVLPSGYSNAYLKAFYARTAVAIREVDPNHVLFIEGNWYATDFSQLTPPFDSNMIYTFHKYWNATDQASIQNYLNIRDQFNVPLWLGESGENSNPWFYETVQLMEQNQIGWNWWTHKKVATTTSPLSAPLKSNYRKVLDYWNGKVPRPSADFARQALFEMAQSLAYDSCEFRPDVLAALLDPDFGRVSKPFVEQNIPGIINCANYDLGTQGIAYSDADYKRVRWDIWQPWNQGSRYRNDGVDIEESKDSQGFSYNIGWTESGEWVSYTVQITQAGSYSIEFRVASQLSTGALQLLLDGAALTGVVAVPNTGGWQNWQSIIIKDIQLPAGKFHLTLKVVNGGFNINSIKFILQFPTGIGKNSHFQSIGEGNLFGQNFPNPFNSQTQIPVYLNEKKRIKISIFDISGKKVVDLVNGEVGSGWHFFLWDGQSKNGQTMASGIYFYQVKIANNQKYGKMILVR